MGGAHLKNESKILEANFKARKEIFFQRFFLIKIKEVEKIARKNFL